MLWGLRILGAAQPHLQQPAPVHRTKLITFDIDNYIMDIMIPVALNKDKKSTAWLSLTRLSIKAESLVSKDSTAG